MTSVCFTPLKVPRVRVTKLDACGTVVTGSCSQVVTDGIISVNIAKNYENRQEFFVKNGDGQFCVKETTAPILKWLNMTYTFCNVDPDILNLISGEPLYVSDDANGTKKGWSTQEGSVATVNFAFEAWTRLAATTSAACTGGPTYGYVLIPFNIEGVIGDMKLENGVADFTVTTRTKAGSNWGVGPFNVDLSQNVATLGNPIRMLTPIGALQHHRMFITQLAPPASQCGCQAV